MAYILNNNTSFTGSSGYDLTKFTAKAGEIRIAPVIHFLKEFSGYREMNAGRRIKECPMVVNIFNYPVRKLRNAIINCNNTLPFLRMVINKSHCSFPKLWIAINIFYYSFPHLRKAINKFDHPLPQLRNAIIKILHRFPQNGKAYISPFQKAKIIVSRKEAKTLRCKVLNIYVDFLYDLATWREKLLFGGVSSVKGISYNNDQMAAIQIINP